MRTLNWSPIIEKTGIPRSEFLSQMLLVNQSDLNNDPDTIVAKILRLAEYNLLNHRQIASIVGCGHTRVRDVLNAYEIKAPDVKGFIEPAAIEGMLLVCQARADGRRPDPLLMEKLVPYISGTLLETLTGTPLSTYKHFKRKAENAAALSR